MNYSENAKPKHFSPARKFISNGYALRARKPATCNLDNLLRRPREDFNSSAMSGSGPDLPSSSTPNNKIKRTRQIRRRRRRETDIEGLI